MEKDRKVKSGNGKEKELIEYDDEFIKKIMVYKEKEDKSAVDEREEARYGPSIKMKEVEKQYDKMMALCKKAISQAQDIVLSDNKYEVPKELL